jgi:hypothetical protein
VLGLSTKTLLNKAIAGTVEMGRMQGHGNLNANVDSTFRVVLIRIIDGSVLHTRRLSLVEESMRCGQEATKTSKHIHMIVQQKRTSGLLLT